MFEKVLQVGETIELQEGCVYCGNGAMATIKNGHAILTNRRLFVCKKKFTPLVIILSIAIFAVIYIGIAIITGFILGAIPGMLLGVVSFGAGTAVSKLLSKETEKSPDTADVSFNREDIVSAEAGSRGVHKMLVIKTNNGTICKIGVKNKEQWKSCLNL